MRIAFITVMGGSRWGGSEVLWSATAKAAIEAGHQVFFAAFDYEDKPASIRALLDAGATAHFRPFYNASMPVRAIRRLRQLARGGDAEVIALKAFRPDRVIISQGGSYDMLYYPALQEYLLQARVPYFLICHNYKEGAVLDSAIRQRMLALYRGARQVLAICRIQMEVIQEQLLTRLANMSIVNNPLNISGAEVLPLPDGEKVMFASVASLHVDRKGQDLLLRAFSGNQWAARDWQLNLYGTGPDQLYLEQLAQYFGLERRVVFHGHVDDIRALWAANHLLVLSSRIETGPMALLEAMLCGRPAVTTLVGKVHEIMTEGKEGFIAPGATAALLEQALERAWEARARWSEMGTAAFAAAYKDTDPVAAKNFLGRIVGT